MQIAYLSASTSITTWAELSAIGTNETTLDQDYVLANDISSSTTGYDTYASSSANGGVGWIPIPGTFTGTFDGQNNSISDIYISRPDTAYSGLFTVLGECTISNLTISNVDITGKTYIGILTGADLTTTTVTNVIVSGTIASPNTTGTTAYIGGLIGSGRGEYNSCTADVTITTPGNRVGGFIGSALNTGLGIINCYSSGTITATGGYVGGFMGYLSYTASISNCYSTTEIAANSTSNRFGGFIGYRSSGTISNCYSIGKVYNAGSGSEGGFSGDGASTDCFWNTETSECATSDSGTGKTTAEMKVEGTFTNWDFETIWEINANYNNGYPSLLALDYPEPIPPSIRKLKGKTNITWLFK